MAQAASSLSRRSVLNSAAALSTALLSITSVHGPDAELLALEPKVIALHDRYEFARQKAEDAKVEFSKWLKLNPRPQWQHLIYYTRLEPFLDAPESVRNEIGDQYNLELRTARIAWTKQHDAMVAKCGLYEKKAAFEDAKKALTTACEDVADIPAKTLAGLRMKARLVDKTHDTEMAVSLAFDFADMEA